MSSAKRALGWLGTRNSKISRITPGNQSTWIQRSRLAWKEGGNTESSEGVHDEIHPQQLEHIEWSVSFRHRSNEGHHQSHEVNGELELEKFADVVED